MTGMLFAVSNSCLLIWAILLGSGVSWRKWFAVGFFLSLPMYHVLAAWQQKYGVVQIPDWASGVYMTGVLAVMAVVTGVMERKALVRAGGYRSLSEAWPDRKLAIELGGSKCLFGIMALVTTAITVIAV